MSAPEPEENENIISTLKRKREYKKDSIYVTDLYTLTFDENETVESLGSLVENVSTLRLRAFRMCCNSCKASRAILNCKVSNFRQVYIVDLALLTAVVSFAFVTNKTKQSNLKHVPNAVC